MKNIESLIFELIDCGLIPSIEDGEIHVEGDGEPDDELLSRLRNHKEELTRYLSHHNASQFTSIQPTSQALVSCFQENIAFLQKSNPAMIAYNICFSIPIEKRYSTSKVRGALEKIIERHDSFRYTFQFDQNGCHTSLLKHEDFLSSEWFFDEDRNDYWKRPFDLENGPLARFSFRYRETSQSCLDCCIHHSIFDGFSAHLLQTELNNQLKGVDNSKTALQYGDYVGWYQKRNPVDLYRSISFWRNYLEDCNPILELPTDFPHSQVQTFSGQQKSCQFTPDEISLIDLFIQNNGGTRYSVILSIYLLFLYRLSRQSDFCIGATFANRLHPDTQDIIGMFVNTLPIRVESDDQLTFIAFHEAISKTSSHVFEHQDYPFSKILELIDLERTQDRNPIFQHVLSYSKINSSSEGPLKFNDLGIAHFDLVLLLDDTGESIDGYWEYNTDLYLPATIERFSTGFANLLTNVLSQPEQKIGRISMLEEAARNQLLYEWNDVDADHTDHRSLVHLFEEQVKRNPDSVALTHEGQVFTYAALDARANRVAHYLLGLGATSHQLVGIKLERTADVVISLLGILKAGAAYLPLDPSYPKDRLAFMLEDAAVLTVLTQRSWIDDLAKFQGHVSFLEEVYASDYPQDRPSIEVHPDDLAYVIYTSGSTGKPKGVQIFHGNVTRLFAATQHWFHFDHKDVWTLFHSYAFDFSVWEIWGPLLYGGKLVVVPYMVSRDPETFYKLLCDEGVTVLNQTPSAFQQLIRAEEMLGVSDQLALRLVIFGGEKLEFQSLRSWFERHGDRQPLLVNMYGITETTVHVTYRTVLLEDLSSSFSSNVGRPIPDLQVYILDSYLEPVPIGVTGEIFVGGYGLARGYLKRPIITAERFIPNPFSGRPGDRLYRTGDLARFLPNGDVDYLGRIDHQVQLRGFRIELGEIESALAALPEVAETIVLVRELVSGDEHLVAWLVPKKGAHIQTDGLAERLVDKLPNYMIPNMFVVLDSFPLTPNGKIDRKQLSTPDRSFDEHNLVAPTTPMEQALANIWCDVLELDQVGVNSGFFDLGGNSLLVVRVTAYYKKELNSSLSIQEFFSHPTIAAQARLLDMADTSIDPETTEDDSAMSAPRSGPLPLSFSQKGLWFIDHINPGNPVYNIFFAFELTGPFHLLKLNEALRDLIRRHEAPRTVFKDVGGQPQAVIKDEVPEELLHVVDISHEHPVIREQLVKETCQREGRTTFDLANGPLYRFTLLKLGDRAAHLLMTLHHIIADGWSIDLLLDDLSEFYQARIDERNADLPNLDYQYVDFSHWQLKRMEGPHFEKLVSYWRQQLQDSPAVLRFPTDRPRPKIQAFKGAMMPVSLGEELGSRLRALAKSYQATPYIVLHSIFVTALARYSGQRDILVGMPIANRTRLQWERIVGYFINSIVLRSRIESQLSFSDLLLQVRGTVLGGIEHGDLPFDLLVETLQPERDPSRNPFFQVMFVLQPESGTPKKLGDLDLSARVVDIGVAHFDFTLSLSEGDPGFAGFIEYNSSLFDHATIAQFMGHFRVLCQHLPDEPTALIDRACLLDADERQTLLVAWNDSKVPYERSRYFHRIIEEHGERTPDAPALSFQTTCLTYHELNHKANQLARHLNNKGVGPGQIVGISMARCADIMVAVLAVFKAGGAYLPLDPEYPRDRLDFMVEDTGLQLILINDPATRDLFHEAIAFVDLSQPEQFASLPETAPVCEVEDQDLAYVIYTSGTTGKPKGVLLEHGGLANLFVTQAQAFEISAKDRLLLFASFNFDAAIYLAALCYGPGACMHVAAAQDLLGNALERHILSEQITVLLLPPSVLTTLDPLQIPRVHTLIVAGEAVSTEAATLWGKHMHMYNGYGPTESTVWGTCARLGADETPPIGRPVANTQVYILDRHMNPLPPGVAGEVHIAGICLARGYLKRPGLTAEKFIPNPFSGDGTRLYRTGDLATYRRDGQIMFLGRIDHQVKIRGFRVELGEIESSLRHIDQVKDALVMVHTLPNGEKRLAAYLVSDAPDQLHARDLREKLTQKLPDYMVPGEFVVLDAFPLTSTGSKVDRKALAAMRQSNDTPVSEVMGIEEQIGRIWRKVLDIKHVDPRDNFFDLGGHSLLLVQLQGRLQEHFGRDIPITDLFLHTTVSAQAEYLEPGYRTKALQLTRNSANPDKIDIAIVGMAGRFPGAHSVDELWENLCNAQIGIRFFSDDELRESGVEAGLLLDPGYVKAAGFIEDSELFDASFFSFSPREARLMDPQQRLFLEHAWSALEHAGYDATRYEQRIGVFGGVGANLYQSQNLATNPSLVESAGIMQLTLLNDKDFLATRVSYQMNLKGPAVSVQTACSTSLVAVHLACASLLRGDCDMALAGGARLSLPQKSGYVFQDGGVLSPDGHCRPFDARAEGTVPGSGVAIVVLKRLSDACADNDTIHAVIKASGINNDGSDKIGFTAPSIEGQARVIAEVHGMAGLDPETIGYVEAHGTGTVLGDPIEVAALNRAFAVGTDATGFCALGSAKANLGHLDAAAGVTGLIKAALAVKHDKIPANPLFEKPNPKIDFATSPFYINHQLIPFPESTHPRRAAVSSFGLGGTNAHAVLEQPPAPGMGDAGRPWQVLCLSAQSKAALDQMANRLGDHLAHANTDLADAAFTLKVGRKRFEHRGFAICRNGGEAAEVLTAARRFIKNEHAATHRPDVVFMFSGQGSQYVGMARGIYEQETAFRDAVDYCCDYLKPLLDVDLRTVMFPEEGDGESAGNRLNQTDLTQPALFTIEYALAQLWISWGIQPTAMIGHSIGEFVAATIAGVFSLEDALRIVSVRGQLMQKQPPGDMLAVPLSEEELLPLLVGHQASVATINTPGRCVIAGDSATIATLKQLLAEKEIECRELHTSHAFHSHMMEEVLAPFIESFQWSSLNPPNLPYISNVTGKWITQDQATDPAYWAHHLRHAVRFSDGVRTILSENKPRVFLECGPGKALVTFVKQHLGKAKDQFAIASLRHPKSNDEDGAFLAQSLGQLWLAGLEPDWSVFYGEEKRFRVPLPTYPFERKRFWIEPGKVSGPVCKTSELRKRLDIKQWFYVPVWRQAMPVRRQLGEHDLANRAPWLIFADECGLGEALAQRLRPHGPVALVSVGHEFQRLGELHYSINPSDEHSFDALYDVLDENDCLPSSMIHLWSVTPVQAIGSRVRFAEMCTQRGFLCLMHLARLFERRQYDRKLNIGVITNRMQEVVEGDLIHPEKATILGMTKVIPREYPDYSVRTIDVLLPNISRRGMLVEQILDEMTHYSADSMVAYRGRQRWVQEFEQVPLEPGANNRLRQRGTYLITGGLGGVGLLMAEHLAKSIQARLILTRRSAFPRQEDWDQWLNVNDRHNPISKIILKLKEMQSFGAELMVVNADVTHFEQMNQAITEARRRFGAIHGILHAAGVTPSGMISDMTQAGVERVLSAKVKGTLVLDEILGDDPLDFNVLFSSTSAILGNLGFGDYVAANAFLDAFAHYKMAESQSYTVAVNWDGWQEVGMAVSGDVGERNKEQGAAALADAISNQEGTDCLDRILAANGAAQLVVNTRDLIPMLEEIRQFMGAQAVGDLVEEMDKVHAAEPSLQRPEGDTDYQAPQSETEKIVAQYWAESLGFDRVGRDDQFLALGGDSLMGAMLASKLRKVFKVKFGARLITERPTVAEQAAYIDEQLDASRPQRRPPFVAPETETEKLLTGIWAELFKLEQVGIKDNFKDLGGQPAHIETVVQKLVAHFGLPFAADLLLEEITLEDMADHVDTVCWASREHSASQDDDEIKEFEI